MKKTAVEHFFSWFGTEVIFLDLETTGINQTEDRIIEIGAALVRNGKIVETYHRMVNPEMHLSYRIEHLTGICNEDLVVANPLFTHLESLREFIGERPIFAHNSDFEKNFLTQAFGAIPKNSFYDTCYFACLAMPDIPSYSLESLMIHFGIRSEEEHRALEDAIDAKKVMEYLIPIAASEIPSKLIEHFRGAYRSEEQMVKDLLDAVAYTQKNMGDCDQQQFFQFGSETSSKLETNVDFINLLQDAMVNDRNSFYNLEGNMPRIPMVVDTLLNNSNKTSLVLLPDFVSFRRLEEILPQEALQDGRILLLDRFYNYICDEYLDSRIDELVKEKQATGFEFYLSLLLCKGKQILRNYIAPFLLYRQPVGQHLLDVAAESRWECSVNGCERRNCILGNLEENIEKAQVVITSASNLFVMEKLDKIDVFKQERIIMDGLEFLDNFHEPYLESFRLKNLESVLTILKEETDENTDSISLSKLAVLSLNYLHELLTFLGHELEGQRFRIPLNGELHRYEDYLCRLLNLYIHSNNLEKGLPQNWRTEKSFKKREAYCQLRRFNRVFDEFFAKDSQSVTFLQPHEDGDFSLSVRNVELTGVFRSLMESRQRSFHFTSSVNDHRVLKNFTLVKTGLDSLGKIDIKDIRAKEESRINLLIPDNVPEFSLRKVNHPDFIKGLFQFIMKLLIRKRGKTLVVVNSLARLQKLATMLSPEMDKEKILFLQQHVDGGKEKLLRVVEGAGEVLVLASQVFYNLMDGEKAVFDTVIVERLPFPLPIDEIVRKRRASFRKRGHDDFDDYIVPHTLLKLKGVAGRLVPGGLLVVADNSLPDKGYYPLLEDVIRPNETYSTLHEYLPLSGDFL